MVKLLKILVLVLAVYILTALFPWKNINWGSVNLSSAKTITVVGYAQRKELNKVASFSAEVRQTGDNKDEVVKTVNDVTSKLIEDVKNFGVPEADIKTENISIYREQSYYLDNGVQKTKPGQWNVSNSVSIVLKDGSRANDLTNLLAGSGATNVYGPSFSLDNIQALEDSLLSDAFKNAYSKAKALADANGMGVGKVLGISEGASNTPVYGFALEGRGLGGGGGADLQQGTSDIQKQVTVTFELINPPSKLINILNR